MIISSIINHDYQQAYKWTSIIKNEYDMNMNMMNMKCHVNEHEMT